MGHILFSYRGWATFRTFFKIQGHAFAITDHIEKFNGYPKQDRGKSMLKYLRGEN